MPYNQFLKQIPEDFGAAFPVSGFEISNQSSGYPLLEPFPYDSSLTPFSGVSGMNINSTNASGELLISSPIITWDIINPSTREALSPE